ncbi:MAG: NFACT family protein, partial [Clostridia bacterium]|nr:NFACT family protein [Clostridia bacterium]
MPYDGLVLAAVVQELQPLIDTRIDKIYQPLREEIHLLLRSAGEKVRLLLNTNSNLARVHLTWQSKANPTFPPVFCMVLRKHLEGGRIKAIRQMGLDRVLHLEIENRDELGQLSLKTLILEIMGKHSNLILVNEQGEILDGIRRYGHAVSRHREILPGQLYIAPPAQNKKNPLDLNEEEFFELLLSQKPEALVWQIIQQKLEALSPLTAREILLQCNLPIN